MSFPVPIGLMNNKAPGDSPELASTIFRLDSRDGVAGSKTFVDRSQNAISITNPSNNTVYSATQSRDPSGVSIDVSSGGQQSLLIPNDQAFAIGTGAMTLEVGMYALTSGNQFVFANIHDWSSGMLMSTNSLRNLSGDTISAMDAPTVPHIDAWGDYVWTRDGAGSGDFYVDGVLKVGGYADSRSVVGAYDAIIGKDTANYFIDYIRISSEELPPSEWIMNN